MWVFSSVSSKTNVYIYNVFKRLLLNSCLISDI